jgi:hypothetical protein
LTLPGITLVCGDSHTATHGAFGALAFGIGSSEVEHVLATQTPDGVQHRFEVDAFRKQMLLTGRDEIGLTLGFEAHIREFEARHAREMAWVMPRVST